VGDDPFGDSGAAALGVRTLLLPRTEGRSHRLGLVLRLNAIPGIASRRITP